MGGVVIVVGISNKSNKTGELKPFDISTPSGKLISKAEKLSGIDFVKLNLVPYTPKDGNGKIRYPNQIEISQHYPKLRDCINSHSPCLVFLCGKIVQKAFKNDSNIDPGLILVPIKHPSYISVYKRKRDNEYVADILDWVRKAHKDTPEYSEDEIFEILRKNDLM
jgi:uracil-DNA glycosylase